METEEISKLVDGIYKNILDKFNPGARQMIIAGKAYLKALHGAAAASRIYIDAIGKLGRQAQQGTWGGSADIGSSLMKVVEVYREIQDQQMNLLKAFYVDLLVPLEINLDKDVKVVQSEHKKFLGQHKLRSESYSKAIALSKKQKKRITKHPGKSVDDVDKEIKSMQTLEDEKSKLSTFCEQSLKNAMTQERRRYGFVLERQCSLAKHWLAYHSSGSAAYQATLDEWQEVAKTREYLPPSVESMFVSRIRDVSLWYDEEVYASPQQSSGSLLRKSRSVDTSYLDVHSHESLEDHMGYPLERAKSECSLNSSTQELRQDQTNSTTKSFGVMTDPPESSELILARAMYTYSSVGENQLSFLEGDIVMLLGDRTKGWQFGENLRTHKVGWFPLAYTEVLDGTSKSLPRWSCIQNHMPQTLLSTVTQTHPNWTSGSYCPELLSSQALGANFEESQVPTLTVDTSCSKHGHQEIYATVQRHITPAPTLPAPAPSANIPIAKKMTQSLSTNFHALSLSNPSRPLSIRTSSSTANFNLSQESKGFGPPVVGGRCQPGASKGHAAGPMQALPPPGSMSPNSSNDSGFSNEPPQQPEIDYSDEETHNRNRMHPRNQQFATVKMRKSLQSPAADW